MEKETFRKVSAIGPVRHTGITLKKPSDYAAGIPGVKAALFHTFKEMGVIKSLSTLASMNQKEGFDCPGCAWPDPDKRSNLGEYCENGAKALSEEATSKRVDATFFSNNSVETLSNWTDFEIGKSGRITEPFLLRPDSKNYEPISWDGAFQLIAKHLKQLTSPDEAVFYTSGRSSNEAAFLYGLFARAFGTNNMPDCSNMCHESSGVALSETLGIGKGSVTIDDFEKAEVVMVIGQNPGTNHPRMLSSLQKCKKNGGKIITVNPLEEAGLIRFKNPQQVGGIAGHGIPLTDIFLQVKVNQDVPLLKLIIKKLAKIEKEKGGVFDQVFITEKTNGLAALLQDLEQFNENELLIQSGVSAEALEHTVNLLAKKKKIIICWAMGLTQHKNGVENIKECVNLLLLKGSIGKPGAGTCPVRGHSNVQGDRTVGIMHYVSPKLNAAIEKTFGFKPPEKAGVDVVRAIEAMFEGKAKVFISLGGNFLSAASDTLYTASALMNCELTVSISTKLNRTHLVTGKTALILPTLGRSEKDVNSGKERFLTVENSMGKVHRTKGILKPVSGNLKSEPEIVAGIANAYFVNNHKVEWEKMASDYELLRLKMEAVLNGFKNYSQRSASTGFYLPNNARMADFSKLPNGRAQFSICKLPQHNLSEDDFLLMTIRSHDQFNTTIYGLNDRYRGVFNERRVVFINDLDAKRLELEKLDKVDLISSYDGIERRAKNFLIIPYNIPLGNLAAYFPETNILIPHNYFADKSYTPISKSVRVKIAKIR